MIPTLLFRWLVLCPVLPSPLISIRTASRQRNHDLDSIDGRQMRHWPHNPSDVQFDVAAVVYVPSFASGR